MTKGVEMRVRLRDLLATGLVVALVLPYLAFLAIGDLPLIDDTRDMTAVALIPGGALIYVVVSAEQYDALGWFVVALAGAAALAGFLALGLGASSVAGVLLAVFVALVIVIWAVELGEHTTLTARPRH
ncbi:hypothetical protein ACIBL3_21710 [Kribbella sp. NPDC050124]|uniref:hypothetical protein n=1 Tax=Kribbella sp. NPDC050124 TaxID=3364114 RepID=UPI0037895E90